jgi:hypothetical protein
VQEKTTEDKSIYLGLPLNTDIKPKIKSINRKTQQKNAFDKMKVKRSVKKTICRIQQSFERVPQK